MRVAVRGNSSFVRSTPATRTADVTKFGEDTPFGRLAQPEATAPAYVFFASDADSGFIAGVVLSAPGGETTGSWQSLNCES